MTQRLPELNPPARLLMGPGPSNPDPRVLRAMSMPMVGHLDPVFLGVMDETMTWLRQVYQTQNHHTVPMSATGSAGIETMMVNLLEPGDDVIVGVIGYFGQRIAEVASRTGANVRLIEAPYGEVIAPERFEEELKRKPAKLVALVHAETSTGALQPVAEVAEIAHRYGALIAIDCVTSLGGLPVKIDEWGIDAAASCSQKCLGAPPGLSPVTFGPRAIEAVQARKQKVQSWYLDLNLLFAYWGDGKANTRVFHHTAPVSMLYAMREALRIVLEEGLEARFERHAKAHRAFNAGLEAMGLSLFTSGPKLPMLNVVNIPEGVQDLSVRKRLLEQDIEISGGFGPLAGKTWRIGLMGVNAQMKPVVTLLGALEQALAEQGYRCERGAAVEAATAVYKA
ncbi:MAG TPA: alanine--glyoxylate aminotransferase family protein [Symbiobacteriaceae bacterium]|nr:alanine--glyoxylate aminotransferase family protein [Symbiobacteriaceae bacterium]